MTLRPPATCNKALVSSTSGFVGEYEADGILLTHAWSHSGASANAQRLDGPTSWSAFVAAFETPPFPREAGSILPNHGWISEQLTWYLSVLFGKRFDNHGLIETIGMFNLPNLERVSAFCRHTLPHNSRKVRADYPVPLNLAEVARIEPMISDAGVDRSVMRIWHTAAKFYSQALRTFETDAEVAYLHLVTAIEVLTSLSKVETKELYDPLTLRHLSAIENGLPDGVKVAKHFRKSLLAVKKRFIRTITDLVDDDFFSRSESSQEYGRLKATTFETCVAAAYDLRSTYVHTGASFGRWVERVLAEVNNETQVGMPNVESKDYGKTLAAAPTFIGLERIVRYCLIKTAEQYGAYAEPSPDAPVA